MIKTSTALLLLLFISFIFSGCSESDPISAIGDEGQGNVSLSIDKDGVPDGIVLVSAELSREGYEPITGSMNILDPVSASIAFFDVYAGDWNLKVQAFDENNVLKYEGQIEVTVVEDNLTIVTLQLQPVGGLSTGNIQIIVSWGEPNSEWTDSPYNPIISPSFSNFDYLGVWQPSIMKEEGSFKMWYTGLVNGGVSYIHYATSSDGIDWVKNESPVLMPTAGSWDEAHVSVGQVIKVDGVYKMYYIGWESQYSYWSIGLATSVDGINWEKRSEPVLTGEGWDSQISATAIVKKGNTFYMFYEGRTSVYYSRVGLATSTDGINWVKHDGPVLGADAEWEGAGINFPAVILEDGIFTMVYSSSDPTGLGFGMAKSVDGISWAKDTGNPIFTKNNTDEEYSKISYCDLIKTNNQYRLYYTAFGSETTTINLATKQY